MSEIPPYVNLNGAIVPAAEARVSIFDHGLLYGDGLFETLRVNGGRFFRLDAHLARLAAAAEQLALPLPWSADFLATACRETVAANGLAHGALRLTVTRGEGPPVPDPAVCASPTFFITVRALPPPIAGVSGISACIAGEHPRWLVPGVKATSYLPFQYARSMARRRGCDEALLTYGDQLIEAATGNLFVVRAGEVHTPGLESGCLPGITRAVVLEGARSIGVTCREAPVSLQMLAEAEEIFLTNSTAGLNPVVRLADRTVGEGRPGAVTLRLRDALHRLIEQELAR